MNRIKILKTLSLSLVTLGLLVVAYSSWLSIAMAAPSVTLTVNGNTGSVSYTPGDTLTLGWNATQVTSCTLTSSDGSLSHNITGNPTGSVTGSINHTPSSQVTYTISCSNGASDTATIQVLPTVNLTVTPANATVPSGQTVDLTLQLSTSNADSCSSVTASQPVVFYTGSPRTSYSLGKNGNVLVRDVSSDVTFSVTCTASGGSESDSASFDISFSSGSGSAGSAQITANPTFLNSGGGNVSVSMTSSNVVTCRKGTGYYGMSNTGTNLNTNTTVTNNHNINGTTRFWIRCVDGFGDVKQDSVTVVVDNPAPPSGYNIPTNVPINLDITHTPLVYDYDGNGQAQTRATLHMEGVTSCDLKRYHDNNGSKGVEINVGDSDLGGFVNSGHWRTTVSGISGVSTQSEVDANGGFATLLADYNQTIDLKDVVWLGADCINSETGATGYVDKRIDFTPIDPATTPNPRAELTLSVVSQGDAYNLPEVRAEWSAEYVSDCVVQARKTSDNSLVKNLNRWTFNTSGRDTFNVSENTTVRLFCSRGIDSKTVQREAYVTVTAGGVAVSVSASVTANPDTDPGYCWDTRGSVPVVFDVTSDPTVTKDPSDNSCIFPTVAKPACPFAGSTDRTVITFSNSDLSSLSGFEKTEYQTYTANVGGDHTVRIALWDGAYGRSAEPEIGEQVKVEICEAGNCASTVETTAATADLPDGVDSTGAVLTTFAKQFNFTSGVNYNVGVNHALLGSGTNPDDLEVLCVAIDKPASVSVPTVNLNVNPNTLPSGPGDVNISWSSTDADSCNLTSSPNVFSSTALNNPGQTVNLANPNTTYTFTLLCTNTNGSNQDVETVTVGSASVATGGPNLKPYDLDLTDQSSWSPDRVNGNWDNVGVKIRVENNGDVDIIDPFDNDMEVDYQWAVDSDPSFTADDNGSNSYSNILSLGSLSSVMVININDVKFGEHQFKIDTDSANNIAESNESDNERSDFFKFVPVPDPLLKLEPDRELVQLGESTQLEYEVNVNYRLDCTIAGPGVSKTFRTDVTGPILMGSDIINTSSLSNTSVYRLECNEPITNTTFSAEARVEIVPGYVET
ncbi:hypothetical protein KC723_00555 [Candidatus Kaiserbacteria bacterium]|nr:hypothetical protein [Candidatus Kaiserbacteria bacterium]